MQKFRARAAASDKYFTCQHDPCAGKLRRLVKRKPMNKNERQFQAANAAIERAVERFVTDIDKIMVQRKAIAPHVREQALLILCDAEAV